MRFLGHLKIRLNEILIPMTQVFPDLKMSVTRGCENSNSLVLTARKKI